MFHKQGPFALALLILAVIAGLAGMGFHLILEAVQLLIYHSHDLVGLSNVSQPYLFIVLILTGFIMAVIWYQLQKNEALISVKAQLLPKDEREEKPSMVKHTLHILTQVVSVSLGSPIGKEAAPREFGALAASHLANRFNLSAQERKLLVASGAAGLAAIYQVPIASVFFALETLGIAWGVKNLIFLLLATEIATQTAHLIISDQAIYSLETISTSWQNILLAICLVIIITPLAYIFNIWSKKVGQKKIKDKRILWALPLTFILLAFVTIYFPEIMGNGEAMATRIIAGQPWHRVLFLILIKAVMVLLVLSSGAYGGTLTPSFALGLALAYLLVTPFLPALAGSAMVLGALIFLATSMQAPLTALFLVIGFTGQGLSAYPILVLTVGLTRLYQDFFIKRWLFKD
ncbi:chloride channel protein [Streptococcus loxodontisalivarius]|uniref:H+/Cl- antiporter ClcA n=1 Tax=Streptococcus loxodontisalivarius TaxID=1349415 RepID=A0ABS2PUB9_9STRE|nr:chloride channel protein [Streptococcus loxodontisalivarius]MBM7643653.1 H+/Cl- antiporter ClcA [Streptococcus loxodontisalivarius]